MSKKTTGDDAKPRADDAREERARAYRKAYWADYAKRKKRVHGTLSPRDYAMLERLAQANGRSVWGQVWAESCAYRDRAYVPTAEIERRIETLHAELRRIGNNLNQLAKTGNIFGRLKRPAEVAARLEELEQAIADFTARPWGEDGDGGREDDGGGDSHHP